MANKGLSMRKVREVLRLHYAAGLSTRAIARSLKVSPATVGKYIRRAEEQGLSWPLPEPLDDAALERRLFPGPVLSATQRPLPQWSEVHRELRQWKKVRVNIDYHVELERHYVPHALVGRQLDARITANTVECLYRGQRVASHVRSALIARHTTADEHMPEKHRRMGRWTPERFTRWAENIGPNTGALITTVLGSRRHPQQAFRSCLGILRLAKSYGDARLEAAARRALAIGANS